MAITTTNVTKSYTAIAAQTVFNLTGLSYVQLTADDVLKIYLDGVLQTLTTHYSIVEGAPTKSIITTATITFVTPMTGGEKVLIVRDTDKVQSTVFTSGAFPADSSELSLDKLELQIQESLYVADQKIGLDSGSAISNPTLPLESNNKYLKWNANSTAIENAEAIPDWVTAVDYTVGNLVIESNALYRCTTLHTSVTFSTDVLTKWTQIMGSQGTQGSTGGAGPSGANGATGAAGAAGANGGNGANGIFSAIATQGEAITGTDNVKGMTPLRVKEARLVLETAVGVNSTDIATTENAVNAIDARLYAVEADQGDKVRANGRMRLENPATNEPLVGADNLGLAGRGNRLELNPVGAVSAAIVVEVYRKDDAEVRFSRSYWELHFIKPDPTLDAGTWYLGKKSEVVLVGDPSGVTLAVSQDGAFLATVDVTSDTMAGGNYSADSYIKYKLLEISNQFEDL